MNLILSPTFQKQMNVIRYLADKGNSDYKTLYFRIGTVIKVFSQIEKLSDCPFKLRVHNGNFGNEKDFGFKQ